MLAVASSLCAAVIVALLVTAPAFAAGGGGAHGAARGTRVVRLKDSFFSPSRVTLSRGGAVRFVWAGELVHNLLGPGIPGRLETPVTRRRPYTRVFRRAGRFRFSCSIHPGMEMTVRVR